MIKVVLLLVYLFNGQIVQEQIPMKDHADCAAQSQKIMRDRMLKPNFEEGIIGACVSIEGKGV